MLGKLQSPEARRRVLPGNVSAQVPRQQRLMVAALVLLLISLALVLYRDRDFWFPDTEQAATQQALPVTAVKDAIRSTSEHPATSPKKRHASTVPPHILEAENDASAPPTTITRTVLPPLEVEVVAGDAHQTLRPGTNAIHVDLQRSSSGDELDAIREDDGEQRNAEATNAAENARISTNTAATVVTRSVQPEYPLLARQMKVQGAVVLQALIDRDGSIEDLNVVSGPPILANAAREAVRQWHFKPHLEGAQAVETRANITVNFTISTN